MIFRKPFSKPFTYAVQEIAPPVSGGAIGRPCGTTEEIRKPMLLGQSGYCVVADTFVRALPYIVRDQATSPSSLTNSCTCSTCHCNMSQPSRIPLPHRKIFNSYLATAGVTRHMMLPTSSATSSAPVRSTATPTGRPCASPCSLTKPVNTSSGGPAGRPSTNGTKITL